MPDVSLAYHVQVVVGSFGITWFTFIVVFNDC